MCSTVEHTEHIVVFERWISTVSYQDVKSILFVVNCCSHQWSDPIIELGPSDNSLMIMDVFPPSAAEWIRLDPSLLC